MEVVGASLQCQASKYNLIATFMLQLSLAQIQITKDILALHAPGKRVCVYGSRAQGTARATSDLDLLILGEDALTPESRAELRLAFSESNLPFFVDIVEQVRISVTFFEKIANKVVPFTNDLAAFAGTWSNEDLQEFNIATQSFRRLEPTIWK
jgi:uncharacterized protein